MSASRLVWKAISSITRDDVGDALARHIDRAHGRDRALDHAAAVLGLIACGLRELVGEHRVVRVLLDGRRHLLHRRGRLLEARGLLLGAHRQVRNTRVDLARGGGHRSGCILDVRSARR